MERVEQFQIIKLEHFPIFSVLKIVTFDFMCHTTFYEVRMLIDKVMRIIA